jgi:hypothetical protein
VGELDLGRARASWGGLCPGHTWTA